MNLPECTPPWNVPAAHTLLVVGSAPCLHEDFEAAMRLRPDAHVLLINEAMGALALAHHLLAGHSDKADQFLSYRREKFPFAPPVPLHATWREGMKMPACVTHRWAHGADGATSAWKAVRIGLLGMGYQEAILCGCPLEATGYFNPLETARFERSDDGARIGRDRDRTMYHVYRRRMAEHARGPLASRVFSMSGYTRDLFGAPEASRASAA